MLKIYFRSKGIYYFHLFKQCILFFTAILVSNFIVGQASVFSLAPPLGTAASFGAFSGASAGLTNQGNHSAIHGSMGTNGASTTITGFTDAVTNITYTPGGYTGTVYGGIYSAATPITTEVLADIQTAYNFISPGTLAGGYNIGTIELGGLTLTKGIYKSATTYQITGLDLTLDAQNDSNAVWIFQASSALTVGTASVAQSVILKNGALAKNVFWYVGSAAVINYGGGGTMVGTIISSAGSTFSSPGVAAVTVLDGRIFALNASVTMVNTVIRAENTWVGTNGIDWFDAGNWSTGAVPVSSDEVLIPSLTNNPTINIGIAHVYNLTIYNGANLTDNSNLLIGGSITNANNSAYDISKTGTLTATAGNIVMNGSFASTTPASTISQTIPASTFVTNTVMDLNISNNAAGVTLGGPLNVTGIFTPASGLFNTGNYLTLKSTSITNTAIVGIVGGTINGNVLLERYIPQSQRSFRFLTPGVTTTSSINANWQEGQHNTSQTVFINTNPGYGTQITGSTTGLNGFDATQTGNPSMIGFSNNSSQSWIPVTNTDVNTLTSGQAFEVMIRGDRSTILTTNTPSLSPTTLRTNGILTYGSVTLSTESIPMIDGILNDYSFIGNPYWAPVNWETLTANNLSATYWIWDPTRAGTNNRGAYVSYNSISHSGSAGSINKYIQPGQAFFVQTTGNNPSLSFAETNKAISSNNLTATFGSGSLLPKLLINLFLPNNTNSADGAVLVFDNNFSKAVGKEDAVKFNNLDENIAINNYNTLLCIDARPLPENKDTVQLSAYNLLSTAYTLKLNTENFSNYNGDVILIDNYSNQAYPIDNAGTVAVVPYTITPDTLSKAKNRFQLVFSSKTIAATVTADSTEKFSVTLSSNPVSDQLTVYYTAPNSGNTFVRVFNGNGQSVKTIILGMQQIGQTTIPMYQYPNGIYFVEVKIGSDTVIKKVIKN